MKSTANWRPVESHPRAEKNTNQWMPIRQGRSVPTLVGARRDGLRIRISWCPDARIGTGEGAALSRIEWPAMGGAA